jgi:hypothetical protein
MTTRSEELRKMAADATPGPWVWTKEEYDEGRCWHLSPGVLILDSDGGGPDSPDEFDNANAALIVQAPTLAIDLADALEKIERLNQTLHDAYEEQMRQCSVWEVQMELATSSQRHNVAAARYSGHHSAMADLQRRIAVLPRAKEA